MKSQSCEMVTVETWLFHLCKYITFKLSALEELQLENYLLVWLC